MAATTGRVVFMSTLHRQWHNLPNDSCHRCSLMFTTGVVSLSGYDNSVMSVLRTCIEGTCHQQLCLNYNWKPLTPDKPRLSKPAGFSQDVEILTTAFGLTDPEMIGWWIVLPALSNAKNQNKTLHFQPEFTQRVWRTFLSWTFKIWDSKVTCATGKFASFFFFLLWRS